MAKNTPKPSKQNIEPPKNHNELPNWDKAAAALTTIVREEKDEIIRLCDAHTYKSFQ